MIGNSPVGLTVVRDSTASVAAFLGPRGYRPPGTVASLGVSATGWKLTLHLRDIGEDFSLSDLFNDIRKSTQTSDPDISMGWWLHPAHGTLPSMTVSIEGSSGVNADLSLIDLDDLRERVAEGDPLWTSIATSLITSAAQRLW